MKHETFLFSRVLTGVKPLSVNKAWRGGKRFQTEDYKTYKEEIKWLVNAKSTLKGYIEVHLSFGLTESTYKRCDVDNFAKTTLDSLVEAGVIEDDRLVKKLVIEKYIADNYTITINIR